MTPALEAALMEAAALVLYRARAFLETFGVVVSDELAEKALAKVRELIRQDPGVTNAATLIVEDERDHRIPPLSTLGSLTRAMTDSLTEREREVMAKRFPDLPSSAAATRPPCVRCGFVECSCLGGVPACRAAFELGIAPCEEGACASPSRCAKSYRWRSTTPTG